jgi:VIT1/CCC1 family predicted Fe2+/Mn2+ transporter
MSFMLPSSIETVGGPEPHRWNSDLVKDIIIGMSNGLTVPFALTAGLSGVLNTTHLIVVSGLSEIAAGCISMGLGGYLAGESEVEHYDNELKREFGEIETVPATELKEVADILVGLGVEEPLSKQVAIQISQDKTRWADFNQDRPDRHHRRRRRLRAGEGRKLRWE